MTAIEARAILSSVVYRDWNPLLSYCHNGAFWLHWSYRRDGQERRSQRWYVGNTMSRTELVELAWQAVQAAEVQEARQHFLYRNRPIFSTRDVELLSELHIGVHAAESPREKEEHDVDAEA